MAKANSGLKAVFIESTEGITAPQAPVQDLPYIPYHQRPGRPQVKDRVLHSRLKGYETFVVRMAKILEDAGCEDKLQIARWSGSSPLMRDALVIKFGHQNFVIHNIETTPNPDIDTLNSESDQFRRRANEITLFLAEAIVEKRPELRDTVAYELGRLDARVATNLTELANTTERLQRLAALRAGRNFDH